MFETIDAYTEVKVILDDRDPDNTGWLARAYLAEGGDDEIQIDAESWEDAVLHAREHFQWLHHVAVYDSIANGQPSRFSPPIA